MSINCDVIVIFLIYDQFGVLLPKIDVSKIKRALELKGTFSETTYVYVLTYEISSF